MPLDTMTGTFRPIQQQQPLLSGDIIYRPLRQLLVIWISRRQDPILSNLLTPIVTSAL